jgi:LmbE family N-acetylglucosaminyl deacetylase
MSALTTVEEMGTLLGVWAHPDDEAYLSAGLMALARRRGQRVVVVTATAGERGTNDPQRWPPERLRRRRRREMATSLRAVGVHEHHWLEYPDGGCPDINEVEAVAAIGRIMDDVHPDTIITFGPDGMTGHPDHQAVSAWTTAARAEWAPAARLWHATLLSSFHDEWGELNAATGIFPDGATPPCTPDDDAAAIVRCDGWLLEAKEAAMWAHASQIAPLAALVGEATFRQWWAVEAFAAATPALTGGGSDARR